MMILDAWYSIYLLQRMLGIVYWPPDLKSPQKILVGVKAPRRDNSQANHASPKIVGLVVDGSQEHRHS